ncbi:TPA: hypothetical protein N3A45_003666 [Salmonella enterica subsp. salamae serovar [1],40:z35:e,n,x,z15]|nr:hypothetical protein [Salmonella enterica]HCM2000520.1 hypothetical protein [Salmonella enterica subsp. salamae serovar [1],40:z35:e,n,x,z15]
MILRPPHCNAQSASDPPLSSQTSAIAGSDTIDIENAKMIIRNKRLTLFIISPTIQENANTGVEKCNIANPDKN